jgi:hypothetical protein
MALLPVAPRFTNRDRRFHFARDVDVSGVSGTGVVATGVLFADGQAVVRWIVDDKPQSTVVYADLVDAELIHGHDGKTRLVFDDVDPEPAPHYVDDPNRLVYLTARDLERLVAEVNRTLAASGTGVKITVTVTNSEVTGYELHFDPHLTPRPSATVSNAAPPGTTAPDLRFAPSPHLLDALLDDLNTRLNEGGINVGVSATYLNGHLVEVAYHHPARRVQDRPQA